MTLEFCFLKNQLEDSKGKLVLQQEQVLLHKTYLVISKNVTHIDCAAVDSTADEKKKKNTHPEASSRRVPHHPSDLIIALPQRLGITSNFCVQSFDVLATISQEFSGTLKLDRLHWLKVGFAMVVRTD